MRWGALLVVVCLASTAVADEKRQLSPGAKIHLDTGLKHYAAKEYEKAAAEFELAYAIDPDPSLLYAGAQALRLGNLCAKALPLYKKYLEQKLKPDQVTAGKTGIEMCEAKIAAEPKPVVEPPKPVETAKPIETPKPEPDVEPKPPEGKPLWRDPIGGGLVVAGLVGVGVGIVFTSKASATEKDARAAEFRDEFESGLDKATSQRRLGAIALIGGAAIATGGVLRLVLRDRAPKHVALGASGNGLFVAGWFR